MKKLFWILPLMMFVLTACPNNENGTSSGGDLPENPEKLIIRLNEDGGMNPLSYGIYICKDSAYWQMWRSGNQTKLNWTPTENEIADLYQVLKENNVNKIKSKSEGEVYDRGGTSIDVDINSQSYDLNNSGNAFIDEKWRSNFNSISSAIWSYASQKVDEQKIEVPIHFGDSLKSGIYPFDFSVNDIRLFFNNKTAPVDTTFNFYPGFNEIYSQTFYPDSASSYGGLVTYEWNNESLEITPEVKAITIRLSQDGLVYEIEN
ncbi:hypothetical protein K6119_03220 [Paracrocinitomix mangrovi]|uniref:hypothetical protein n=1 Tax=Paracrocinitomix mangrovi TaxID=2862509 RepID=UPI001C8E09A8|nr:hypothetical protein [Paracrocinitomix mangrovi]UKN02530.1 hypothetical protein K6119_03220 [Paracrocinitomix mangrovi]